MSDPARNITNLRPPEQVSEQKQPIEPWLRQKGEPARLYLWLKCYLEMGPKRSLRALVAAEAGTQVNTGPAKKLSDVSVPRAWKRASKVWNWVERAEAYDLDQMEKQAQYIRQFAGNAPFASKAYRVLQLSWLARALRDMLKESTLLKDTLALMARYQSVMRDMAAEMEGLEVALDSIDAKAFTLVQEEAAQQEFEEKLKNASMHERNKIILDRYDRES